MEREGSLTLFYFIDSVGWFVSCWEGKLSCHPTCTHSLEYSTEILDPIAPA
jgi:hypothetical protein